MAALRAEARAIIAEAQTRQTEETIRPRNPRKELEAHLAAQWEARWKLKAAGTQSRATTWTTEWSTKPLSLYDGLQKHEATALFLLRTEVLGLKDWLARVGVPEARPDCPCGARRQTLNHILAFCPNLIEPRIRLVTRAGTTELRRILTDPQKVKYAARWLLETRTLEQFSVALEVEREEMEGWRAFQTLREVPV